MLFDLEKEEEETDTQNREYYVEKILDEMLINGKKHFLIKWLGYEEAMSTWYPRYHLLNAKDKLQEWYRSRKQSFKAATKKRKTNHTVKNTKYNKYKQRTLKLFQYKLKSKPKVWYKYEYARQKAAKELMRGSENQLRKHKTEKTYFLSDLSRYEKPKQEIRSFLNNELYDTKIQVPKYYSKIVQLYYENKLNEKKMMVKHNHENRSIAPIIVPEVDQEIIKSYRLFINYQTKSSKYDRLDFEGKYLINDKTIPEENIKNTTVIEIFNKQEIDAHENLEYLPVPTVRKEDIIRVTKLSYHNKQKSLEILLNNGMRAKVHYYYLYDLRPDILFEFYKRHLVDSLQVLYSEECECQ